MVNIKFPIRKNTAKDIKTLAKCIATSVVLSAFVACGTSTVENQQMEEVEVLTPAQGVITKVKEVEESSFKITDEEIVPNPADSRIIATYMDGSIDTLTLDEAKLEDQENPRRGRFMRSLLMGGMIGYMMGNRMSKPLNKAAYANSNAYNKSNTTNNKFRSSATKTKVSSPKKGFGSKKSTKTYGG